MHWDLRHAFAVVFLATVVDRSVSFQAQYGGQDGSCDSTCADMGMGNLVDTPFAVGDPHMKNLRGESFDVVREGVSTLLSFPRPSEWKQQQEIRLRVDASIEHPGNESRCKGFFILRLLIMGSLIGEDIELDTRGNDLRRSDALKIRIGNTTMRTVEELAAFDLNGKYKMVFRDNRRNMAKQHLHHRLKFATLNIHLIGVGVGLEITWFTGKKQPNRLDFKAQHLSKLGNDWGGILGSDDHSWESSWEPNCKKSKEFDHMLQLLDISDNVPWEASASLE